VESKQLRYNTICSVLNRIDDYYITNGAGLVNSYRFDVPHDPNFFNYKIISAFDRILRTQLCDTQELISDGFLEKAKLFINGMS